MDAQLLNGGLSYNDLMGRAREAVKPGPMGLLGKMKMKTAATGARIIEISGPDRVEQADLLAGKLREALATAAKVERPTKCLAFRLSGLDDSINRQEVIGAICEKMKCPAEQIKVSDIRAGPGGLGTAVVRCPVKMAKAIMKEGRVLVGWSSAKVTPLDPRPLRCFKCMAVGHTRPRCPSLIDRSKMCFRCGESDGHKADDCRDERKCQICIFMKCANTDHVMGSAKCRPPVQGPRNPHWDKSAYKAPRTQTDGDVAAAALPSV